MSLQEHIAEQIAKCAPQVEGEVVTAIVDREVKKRSTAVVQCLDKLSKLEGELRRVKPDSVAFNADGTVASALFTKPALEARDKLVQRIDKVKKAIDKAFDKKPDFSDVYNHANSSD